MEIVVRPHILSNRARRVEDIDYGMTIQEVVDRIPGIDERVRAGNLAVLIDGVTVPRSAWNVRRISKVDAKVEVMAVLSGGGSGSNKQILALVATVFLFAFAGWAAAGLTSSGGLLAGASYLTVKAGIVLVGTLLINAIFKPPLANNNGAEQSATYGFSGQNNQAKPFGRLTRIYGRHRYIADIAAVPYTVNAGDDQYLYVVYSFGYGPLDLEDFKIGTNPIGNYSDVDMIVHENFTDPSQLQIYRKDVWQDSYSFEMVYNTPITVTTQVDTDRAMLDIAWPSGLGERDSEDGDEIYRTSLTQIEYRVAGSADPWLSAQVRSVSKGKIQGNAHGSLVADDTITTAFGYNEDTHSPGLLAGRTTFTVDAWDADGPPLPGSKVEIGTVTGGFRIPASQLVLTVQSADATTVTFTTPLPWDLVAAAGQVVAITYQSPIDPGNGMWEITGFYGSGFSASADLIFPSKGQWEIRATKLDPDEGDSSTKMWKKYVTSLKSLKNTPPINPVVPITIVELRIRATGQLNGNIERFSAIATSKLRTWDGSAWVVAPTRNTAWVYLDILSGTANPKAIPDSRIDLDRLKEWAVRCDNVDAGFAEPLGTCDIVIDRSYTIWELLQSVAVTGRAAPGMRDNLYSVIIDDANRQPVQMFTPRNSWNLQSQRTYVKEPHGLRVKWVDPVNDWGPGEITVYNTGYNATNATEFEDLQSFGMTRPEQVTRWGRYMLAQGRLRQERFSLETDIENIVCTRGDLVLVAHDVLEVGGEACRVVEVDGNNVFIDAPPTIDTTLLAADAGIRIRRSDGTFTDIIHLTAYGNDGEFDFVTIDVLDAAQLTGVAAGDLLVFGPVSSVTAEYVVDYIRPNGELGATIGFEELAPGVYTAESSGVIPEYVPPGGGRLPAPAVSNLSYQLMEYVSGIRPMAKIKLKWRPSSTVSYLPESYRVVEIMPDGTELLVGDQATLEYETKAMNMLNWNGKTRKFSVRADYGARGISDWSQISVVLPTRTAIPPAEVDLFEVTNLTAERRRYTWKWNSGQPEEVVGVQIRYVAGTVLLGDLDWSTMTQLVPDASFIAQSGIELNKPLGAGTYTFLCRSVDSLGNLSPVGYRVVAALTIESAAPDTTATPTPTGFTATGGFNSVTFTSDNPSYTMGRGHSHTQVYAAVYSGTGPLPVFSDSVPFCGFTGERGVAGAPPATTYRFWAKWVSKDGGISAVPFGGTNGVAATTAIDVEATLDALTGQLTEDQLYVDLGARIDLIDGPDTMAGSVAARILAEANARNAAIVAEQNTRATADTAEANSRLALAAKMSNQANGSIFVENWEDPNTLTNWENFAGSGEFVIQAATEQGAAGGKLLKVGNNSGNDETWRLHKTLIPFNPNKLYRMEIRVKKNSGTGVFYAGVTGVAADGVTLVHPNGASSFAGHYFAAAAEDPGVGAGWKTYVGYLKGFGASVGAAGDNWDPTAPAVAHPSVRYLRPMFIANYDSVAGEMVIGQITITEGIGDLNAAAIVTEQSVRASADSAMASSLTTLTAEVRNTGGGSVFDERFPDAASIDQWERISGGAELSIVSVTSGIAGGGGTALKIGNSSGDDTVVLVHKHLIPYDSSRTYKTSVTLTQLSGTGVYFVGFAGVAADGVTLVNLTGANTTSTQHYHVASDYDASSAWGTLVGYTKGLAASGTVGPCPDKDAPGAMHTDVRYIRPILYVNNGGTTGDSRVARFKVEDITDVMALDGELSAMISTEQTVRADADSAMASNITTLQTKVITSPNLLPNGGFERKGAGWTMSAIADTTTFELDGWGPCYYKNSPADGTGVVTSDFFPCTGGAAYTITGDTRLRFNAGGSATDCYLDLLFYDNTDTIVLNTPQNDNTAEHFFSVGDTNRNIHAITAAAPATAVKMKARFVWTGTGISNVGVRNIKVERGTVATPYTQEVTMQAQSLVTDGLSAQYTVKIDNNGYVTGFGLASTAIDGTPISTFAVRSDKFYIASPSGPGVAAAMPFIVYTTTQTINGASVPPGVYMRSAFIHNAFITSAMIQNLDASKVNATSLSAITATIGTLRTASSGARLEIKDNVIKVFDSSNVLRVQLGDLTL